MPEIVDLRVSGWEVSESCFGAAAGSGCVRVGFAWLFLRQRLRS